MTNIQRTFERLSFGPEVRRRFYSKMSSMVHHNIGVLEGVSVIRDRMRKRRNPSVRILDRAVAGLNAGQKLNEVFSGDIPNEEAMLIQGGIQSGKLPESLELAAKIIAARKKIVEGVRQALGYPSLLSGMFLILLFVVSHKVIPELARISDPESWQTGAYILYAVASFVNSVPGLICLIVPGALLVLSILTLPTWTGQLRIKLDRLPRGHFTGWSMAVSGFSHWPHCSRRTSRYPTLSMPCWRQREPVRGSNNGSEASGPDSRKERISARRWLMPDMIFQIGNSLTIFSSTRNSPVLRNGFMSLLTSGLNSAWTE